MGKGRFLMDLARLHPEINYIGIERYTSVLLRAREFDTLKSKKVPQSLEIGLFFCQIFIFII